MIKREFFVVIIDRDFCGVKSIEARGSSMDNAKLFMEENQYILTDLNRPYNPKRYEFSYEFRVVINVDSPWFDDISFELSEFSRRPDSTYSPV